MARRLDSRSTTQGWLSRPMPPRATPSAKIPRRETARAPLEVTRAKGGAATKAAGKVQSPPAKPVDPRAAARTKDPTQIPPKVPARARARARAVAAQRASPRAAAVARGSDTALRSHYAGVQPEGLGAAPQRS